MMFGTMDRLLTLIRARKQIVQLFRGYYPFIDG